MKRTIQMSMFVTCALLSTVPAIHAAATPDQACQKGRYAAAAKYSACEQKVTGKFLAGGAFDKFEEGLSKCRVSYTDTWARLQAKASGTGALCDNSRFDTTSTPGTVIDRLTGLEWEQKTDDASVHDKDSLYSWNTVAGATEANGTAYTSFLAALNGSGFASQRDWRLPTRAELQTILLEPHPCLADPCIDQGVFGPTVAYNTWSATTNVEFPNGAWLVNFNIGGVGGNTKESNQHVRAVRGGL